MPTCICHRIKFVCFCFNRKLLSLPLSLSEEELLRMRQEFHCCYSQMDNNLALPKIRARALLQVYHSAWREAELLKVDQNLAVSDKQVGSVWEFFTFPRCIHSLSASFLGVGFPTHAIFHIFGKQNVIRISSQLYGLIYLSVTVGKSWILASPTVREISTVPLWWLMCVLPSYFLFPVLFCFLVPATWIQCSCLFAHTAWHWGCVAIDGPLLRICCSDCFHVLFRLLLTLPVHGYYMFWLTVYWHILAQGCFLCFLDCIRVSHNDKCFWSAAHAACTSFGCWVVILYSEFLALYVDYTTSDVPRLPLLVRPWRHWYLWWTPGY